MSVKPGVAEARLAKPSQTMLSHCQFNAVVRGFSQTNIAPCIVEFRSGKSSLTENERTIRRAKTADCSSFLTSQASRTGSGDKREEYRVLDMSCKNGQTTTSFRQVLLLGKQPPGWVFIFLCFCMSWPHYVIGAGGTR